MLVSACISVTSGEACRSMQPDESSSNPRINAINTDFFDFMSQHLKSILAG
jgi:hypothetical protein